VGVIRGVTAVAALSLVAASCGASAAPARTTLRAIATRRTSTTRGPVCTRATSLPVRVISHAPAMRVPLPDISATEPSVLRIVIQTSSPSTRSTSRQPSPAIS
jgi:hypothetical protein